MSHEARITGEEKRRNAVRIEFEVELDGKKIGHPEVDGEVLEGHFDVDYGTYKDNEQVDRHLETWAQRLIDKRDEELDGSEPAKGRKVEI